jgi:hypothetical protein
MPTRHGGSQQKRQHLTAPQPLAGPAWVHGSPHVEELALPKSLKSCNFTLAKAVIRWMSVKKQSRD